MNLTPPSTLVMGGGGSGKTTSLATLLQAGLKLRLLAMEPAAPNRVLERCKELNIDASNFHWKHVSPAVGSWEALMESAKLIKNLTLKELADTRGKPDSGPWLEFLTNIANFKSDRTGEELGDATEWGSDCAFAIDGLTGMSDMARILQVGFKPNPSPGEWGSMQGTILNVVKKLCADSKCFFVLISHVERETNEITGTLNLTASTLGAKLAPKIPPQFSTVVYAKRVGDQFLWSTSDTGVDTKNGDLPLSDSIQPSFMPIVEGFRARLKAAGASGTIGSSSTAQPQVA